MIPPATTLLRLGAAQRVITNSRVLINSSLPITGQLQYRYFIGRFSNTGAPSKIGTPISKGLGEKILIYYAGKRIVFVATLKLATLFVSGFCVLIAAPSVGIHTEYGYWAPLGIVIGGAIPLAFIQYTSPPYVTHAYLHLPPWARQSQEMVTRYARKLPPSTQISLGTIRVLGRPQLRTVILSELAYKPKRLGCANWEWKPQFEDKKMFRDFYVDQRGSPAKVPIPGIVDEVIKLVREQTQARNKC